VHGVLPQSYVRHVTVAGRSKSVAGSSKLLYIFHGGCWRSCWMTFPSHVSGHINRSSRWTSTSESQWIVRCDWDCPKRLREKTPVKVVFVLYDSEPSRSCSRLCPLFLLVENPPEICPSLYHGLLKFGCDRISAIILGGLAITPTSAAAEFHLDISNRSMQWPTVATLVKRPYNNVAKSLLHEHHINSWTLSSKTPCVTIQLM
jgi:hypothetical protein